MLKKIALVYFALTLGQFAQAAQTPLLKLKDLEVSRVSDSKLAVKYAGDTVEIERLDEQKFKLNGKVFNIKSTDTLEQMQQNLERAYKSSKKKSAALDSLFIQKAHAFSGLFGVLAGGILGLAIGHNTCPAANAGAGNNGGSFERDRTPVTVQ